MAFNFKILIKRIVTASYFIAITTSVCSQNMRMDRIDSFKIWSDPKHSDRVKKEIAGPLPDSIRASMLIAICVRYSESNVDSAMKFVQLVYLLCKKNKWPLDEAWSLDFMGAMSLKKGNAAKALQLSLEALRIYEELKDSMFRAINYKLLGDALISQKDQRGVDYYRKSLKTARPDALGIFYRSWTMIALGSYYLNQNNIDSALLYAQQSHHILQSLVKTDFSNLKYYPDCLNLLGEIQRKSGNANLALEYYRLAIHHAFANNNLQSASDNYMSIAALYKETNLGDSAVIYADKAYKIAEQLNNPASIVNSSKFLKDYFNNKNKLDSAFKYQQIMSDAKDSLLNLEKIRQVQDMAFNEQLRQQELEAAIVKSREERVHNLQYAAIAIGIIAFVILFLLLSQSIIVKTKFIEFFGVLGLLAVFEFINLFLHPYLEQVTNNSPVLMLIVLIVIGALLVPLHHKMEKWMTMVMVEKNKKIRLAAAKRTLASLDKHNLD